MWTINGTLVFCNILFPCENHYVVDAVLVYKHNSKAEIGKLQLYFIDMMKN